MDTAPPWKARTVCTMCGRPLNEFPLFHCTQRHPCCHGCFVKGKNGPEMACPLCRMAGDIPEPDVRPPGIGRPYRYNINTLPVTKYSYSKNYDHDLCYLPSTSGVNYNDNEEKIFETLIGISKQKFYELQTSFHPTKHRQKSKFSLPPSSSKRPFRCPHKPCNKTVALAQLINHFKSDHCDVKFCCVERGKELLLPFNVSIIEHNHHICLAMITVYEVNRLDYLNSATSERVLKACSKFCQKIPICTFWLMVSGSKEYHFSSACGFFWLFTNSEDMHKCTIELGSAEDSMSLSTFCNVSSAMDKEFGHVRDKLRCLIVTKSSLKTILREGVLLNLRVTIH